MCTVKTVYNSTTGSTVLCCYNQVIVTGTFCTESDAVSSDFVKRFDCAMCRGMVSLGYIDLNFDIYIAAVE